MTKPDFLIRGASLLLAVVLTGCGANGVGAGTVNEASATPAVAPAPTTQPNTSGPATSAAQAEHGSAFSGAYRGMDFDYEVNPENFSITFYTKDKAPDAIPVTSPSASRLVEQYEKQEDAISWRYPADHISVSLKPVDDYLSVTLISETTQDNAFAWPEISADSYYLPLGEGKRVPADDPIWKEYLSGQEFSVLEKLSMPFWASPAGEYAVLFVMETPFHTQMNFGQEGNLAFSINNEYPAIDDSRERRFRIYLTDNNPVNAAKLYRNYVIEQGNFVTLEQKAQKNPNIRKLYGAPFIYLWGERVIAPEDLNWPAFRAAAGSPVMNYLGTFAAETEVGEEYKAVMEEIQTQDYVAEYQKNVICNYLSSLLPRPDFYSKDVFTASNSALDSLLKPGYEKTDYEKPDYENLSETDRIQVNKSALAASLPEVFHDAQSWMDKDTVGLIREMKESGLSQAWIGLNSWEQAYAKPELVRAAADSGYLIGSYDSYHSIHEPGNEQWITAAFDDHSLYDGATVSGRNGKKISGFQGVGRKLNPTLALPAVMDRMADIMGSGLPFNSWFIDCDATGEIYDDYTPEHITTQQQDMKARLERMAYICDTYDMVVGSEGGNDFAASTIAFAHGIELPSFSWMDADMKTNKDSEYYIGKYYNPKGGVAEHFSKRIPIKDRYRTLFADPGYDIPLYKLVYNDSVITSYHWDWSTFKIKGLTGQRMLREVLYNVPPMYHLDAEIGRAHV